MAKATAKKKAPVTAIAPAAPSMPMKLDVRLVHSEHWPAIQAYVQRASKVVISDKATCEGALREIEDGKKLLRAAEGYWKEQKAPINKIKDAVLDLEKSEISALESVVGKTGVLEQRAVAWKRADDARVEQEKREQRERDERAAREQREKELKEQEEAAAELEASSPDLSAKELWFVEKMFEQGIDLDSRATVDMAAMSLACKQAGYQDPRKWAERLATSKKVRDAIAIKVEARAKREQAAALREEPIIVPAPIVESRVAKTSATRFTKTFTLDRVADLDAFVKAYQAGQLPAEAMVPNEVHLRRMAKDLGEKFEQAYPGCKVKVLEGVAG